MSKSSVFADMANQGVATTSLIDDAVTLAKMAVGTDGQVITYDASGDPVAVGPGTIGQVLTSAGADAVPAFETVPAAGITHACHFFLSGSYQAADINPYTVWATGQAMVPSGGASVTHGASSGGVADGIFTFPVTGYWLIWLQTFGSMSATGYVNTIIQKTENASAGSPAWSFLAFGSDAMDLGSTSFRTHKVGPVLLDVTSITDCKVRFTQGATTTYTITTHATSFNSGCGFLRIGDT